MTGFDTAVLSFLNGVTGRFLLVDWLFIFFSELFIYILVAAFLLFLFRIKDWRRRASIFSLGVLSVILSRGVATPIIRFFFEAPRPFVTLGIEPLVSHMPTSSFPSGHIAFIIPIVLTIWYINKRAGAWSFAGALLMGIGRVGAGIHWPTDIFGGILIGIICFAFAKTLLARTSLIPERTLFKNKKRAPVGTPV